MAKIPDELVELWRALAVVDRDLRKEIAEHEAAIGGKPFGDWSQEKHDAYHRTHKATAEIAQKWVHIRQMRINPD